MTGNNGSGKPSHHNHIRNVYCHYDSVVRGTVGFKLVGTNAPADVSTNWLADSQIWNAGTPVMLDDGEQNFLTGNFIEGLSGASTGPLVQFGPNANLNTYQGRITGANGQNGSLVSDAGTKNTFTITADDGGSSCFNITGTYDWLICEATVSVPSVGTLGGSSTAIYNGQIVQ